MNIKTVAIAAIALVSVNSQAMNKVIYGDDNRKDVYQSKNTIHLELAKSTAAMITKSNLTTDGDMVKVVAGSLGDRRNLCDDEPFRTQPAAANCSGFLVGPNLLVTAGHCIREGWNGDYPNCNDYSWVFDFATTSAGQTEYKVKKSSVYNCKRVISQTLSRSTQDDFALIELDREVTDRQPLEFRTEGKIADNANLVVIGHPSGLPTKIADMANVRDNGNDVYFNANLDTYGGNSGSAVFNADTGKVEGILVRGEQDYSRDSRGCTVSFRCANDACRGEDVTRITNIQALMEM